MAHFLEHLVFKGGEKYPHYSDVNETAERLGGVLNAYTSHDLVAFHITVRAESAPGRDRPADRLRRTPPHRRRGARQRARRRDPGDQPRLRPALDGRRVPDRPGRLRRPPARTHRARARGEPARVHARGHRRLPRAPLGRLARGRLPRGQRRAPARPTSELHELFGRFPSLPEPEPYVPGARLRAAEARRGARHQPVAPAHDLPAEHRRSPTCASARRSRSTRRCSAARWARACSTRSARSAASATPSTRSPTPSPTCRSCSSARASSRRSASRPTRACARSSTSCAATGPTEEEVAARPRLRRRTARARVRELERRRAPRRQPDDRLRRGRSTPTARSRRSTRSRFDEVARGRRGDRREPRGGLRGTAHRRRVLAPARALSRSRPSGRSAPAPSRRSRDRPAPRTSCP